MYRPVFTSDITLNMNKTSQGAGLATRLVLSAGAFLLLALLLASSGNFGDTNPLGVVMFLGLVFGVPAACLGVLALLALTTTQPHSCAASGVQHVGVGETPGTCPNCEAAISLSSSECPACGALFGEHSSWQVCEQPQRRNRGGIHV